jgi:unsaturated chondroitin disaccharide hydrolase
MTEPRRRALAALRTRVDTTALQGEAGFPHYADPYSGVWTRSTDGDWTGGFWIAMLWLAARMSGEEQYAQQGERWVRKLAARVESETAFRGFLFWYGAALGEVLCNSSIAAGIGCAGARALAELYNSAARLIPLGAAAEEAGDVGRDVANIDSVPGGTALLAWASDHGEDERLRVIGLTHAERHAEICVRDDGSVIQSAEFDVTTGRVRRRFTHKGVSDTSTWARAQAWAMLGFAQAARLQADPFVGVAARVSDWWLDHLPDDGIARWDFDDPSDGAPLDTSATAIAAASLLKLARRVEHGDRYEAACERMVDALVARHLDVGEESPTRGVLRDGCFNNRAGVATAHELVWGDYFLFEVLCSLDGAVDTTQL